MERIPILKMGDLLLVSIQVDMHDRLAIQLQDDLTGQIAATGARGVLIDISALEMVDSFMGRMIANIAAMSRVLDAETVVVGMTKMIGNGDAQNEWNVIMATAVLALLPPVGVVIFMQRWFVKGLTETEK